MPKQPVELTEREREGEREREKIPCDVQLKKAS